MRKTLANGTLGWLVKEMPRTLRSQMMAEIIAEDDRRAMMQRPGDAKVINLANHLRWVIEHRPALGDMKMVLFLIVRQYIPLTIEHMQTNTVPGLVDCFEHWAGLAKELAVDTKILQSA